MGIDNRLFVIPNPFTQLTSGGIFALWLGTWVFVAHRKLFQTEAVWDIVASTTNVGEPSHLEYSSTSYMLTKQTAFLVRPSTKLPFSLSLVWHSNC